MNEHDVKEAYAQLAERMMGEASATDGAVYAFLVALEKQRPGYVGTLYECMKARGEAK